MLGGLHPAIEIAVSAVSMVILFMFCFGLVNAGCPASPSQIPACGIPAPGSSERRACRTPTGTGWLMEDFSILLFIQAAGGVVERTLAGAFR